MITGRITGGTHGWPFAAATFDLDEHGYVEDEWLLEGRAQLYDHRAGTGRSFDGRWSAVPTETTAFATRLLVRRPVDAARFNGTVVLFWNNVSLGFDLLAGESPEIYDGGFAFVGVSTQRNGVHGYPGGASQSANWLATYLNAVQPLTRALDGFILDIYFGNGSPLAVSADTASRLATPKDIPDAVTKMPPGSHLLRDDLDIPVFVLNSETEATGFHPVRQPDSDRFRHWEVAGHAHGSRRRGTDRLPSNWPRDLGTEESPMGTPSDANVLTMEPVRSAALHHFQRWLTDGTAPPRQPPIEFDIEERCPVIRRDHLGIAVGGVRLPDVDVPTASHRGVAADGTLVLTGSTTPFSDEMLRALYPTRNAYCERYRMAVAGAVDAGVLLPVDADRLLSSLG
ncbi:MAG TPA: alpha/beta hydrolase domain-containing protein [Acidimicrobiales bacterium]|nr:alpha/beta hydrolase domain-containing protein [Acidimicrobiales bacterium]